MTGTRESGFTIVEVTLFLAISGLLFLIALLGTGSTIRSVRFTDSGRSLEAYVQKQYDDIVNGVNERDNTISCVSGTISTITTQNVGSSNCLLLGKLLVFTANDYNVTTYNVIGTEPSNVNYSQSDSQLVTAFKPQTVTQNAVSTYQIPWLAHSSGFKRLSDNSATNALLLVRSPKSTNVLEYTFKIVAAPPADLTATVSTAANLGQTTNFCIAEADNLGPPAKLVITNGVNQSAASIVFDASAGDCNGT